MENKKNFIVFFASCPFPYGSASDNTLYTFMAGFNEHGCEGEVVCLYPNLSPQYTAIEPLGEYNGVKYRYLHNRTHPSTNKIKFYVDRNYRVFHLLRKYIKKRCSRYNVIAIFETHVGENYYTFSKICHEAGAKVILRGCEYPEYLIEDTPRRRDKFCEMVKFTDKYILETKTLEDYYKNVLQIPIQSIVVPATMVFEDILDSKRTSVNPYIAYCGSIHSEAKDGLKSILQAYARFIKYYPDVRLKFIGRISKQSYYEELRSLSLELGISEMVDFVGEVDRCDYVRYLTNAQMMIVAKPSGSYYGGGLSSKVIEYLFSGNPVMMTSSDDYVHYLTHKENVYFVEDNSPSTLLCGLKEMFSNPTMMKQIGENGKRYALEHFNYYTLTKDLLQYILE